MDEGIDGAFEEDYKFMDLQSLPYPKNENDLIIKLIKNAYKMGRIRGCLDQIDAKLELKPVA